MNKQQAYKEAVKSIQINKLILNSLTLLGVGTASFFCLSIFAKNMPMNLRVALATSIGVTGGALVVSIKNSPLEDAIAAMYESGSKAYDEHRKQAAKSKSSDLQAIQAVHKQGTELLDELKQVGALINAQILLSDDQYAKAMSSELMNTQADLNGHFLLQLPESGNSNGSQPRNLPEPAQQPQIGGAEVIDFSRHLQRKIQRSPGVPEPDQSSDGEESVCRDSFIGTPSGRSDGDSPSVNLSAMPINPSDPVMLI